MKAKERLSRMRKSTRFGERFMLAADRVPGSKFDREIQAAMMYSPDDHSELDEVYRRFEAQILNAIRKGRSAFFREVADAIDVYHSHKPYQFQIDRVRQTVLWCNAIAKSNGEVLSVERVISRMRESGMPVTDNTPKLVRVVRDELGITIKGVPGRPRKRGKI